MNRSSIPFNGLSDRTGFGLFLIVAFSIGLAAVLIAMGLVAVYAGRMMSRLRLDSPLIEPLGNFDREANRSLPQYPPPHFRIPALSSPFGRVVSEDPPHAGCSHWFGGFRTASIMASPDDPIFGKSVFERDPRNVEKRE